MGSDAEDHNGVLKVDETYVLSNWKVEVADERFNKTSNEFELKFDKLRSTIHCVSQVETIGATCGIPPHTGLK